MARILITGCSSGIGAASAAFLSEAGHSVIATARDVDQARDAITKALALPGSTPEGSGGQGAGAATDGAKKEGGGAIALYLPLDVTNQKSVEAAQTLIQQQFGGIDVLINNAGYGLYNVIEETDLGAFRSMIEVNLLGLVRVTQVFLPELRRAGTIKPASTAGGLHSSGQRRGLIINISSVAGLFATPIFGAYSATKFGVEALSDALRVEVAPFGVDVVLVEPGSIETNFAKRARAEPTTIDKLSTTSPYADLYRNQSAFMEVVRVKALPSNAVARLIQTIINAEKPKARYTINVPSIIKFAGLLSQTARDKLQGRVFKWRKNSRMGS